MLDRRLTLVRTSLVAVLASMLLVGPVLAADDHVVSPADLHKALRDSSQARVENISKIRNLFASAPARDALKSARLDPIKVEKAISLLDDEELQKLAARADRVTGDFAAGALSNQELTYIVIALATAVIILVIVAA